jgi:hypothetical protein
MANKTIPTSQSIDEFIGGLEPGKQPDARSLIELMREITGEEPVVWGASIIGFGTYHYKSAAGTEGDWMRIGFSPRKAAISLYFNCDVQVFTEELTHFGKHKTGKGCIYVKRLEDIDLQILKDMCQKAYELNQ